MQKKNNDAARVRSRQISTNSMRKQTSAVARVQSCSLKEIATYRAFADLHIPAVFGFRLPESYRDFCILRETDSIHLMSLPARHRGFVIREALIAAARAYTLLLRRVLFQVANEFPPLNMPARERRELVVALLEEVVNHCENDYRARLGIDPFHDAIQPAFERRLAEKLGLPLPSYPEPAWLEKCF